MFQNVALNKVNDETEQVDNYFTPLPTTAGIDSKEGSYYLLNKIE